MKLFYPNAKLVRVVDGDTLELLVDVGFRFHAKLKFRLATIDAPEMNTEEGKAARLFAESWFTSKGWECAVTCHGEDKYGRWVATIHNRNEIGETLNQTLIDNGHAKKYVG
jgi:micrococcal nuclease